MFGPHNVRYTWATHIHPPLHILPISLSLSVYLLSLYNILINISALRWHIAAGLGSTQLDEAA